MFYSQHRIYIHMHINMEILTYGRNIDPLKAIVEIAWVTKHPTEDAFIEFEWTSSILNKAWIETFYFIFIEVCSLWHVCTCTGSARKHHQWLNAIVIYLIFGESSTIFFCIENLEHYSFLLSHITAGQRNQWEKLGPVVFYRVNNEITPYFMHIFY